MNINNCATIERSVSKSNKGLGINRHTRLEDDDCYVSLREKQSRSVGDYAISNFYDCEPLTPHTVDGV